MNERRFKDYLMVLLLKANGYGSTNALIKACEAANAIPESEWNRRKAALNAIAEKAPLRESDFMCVVHADIPRFMQEQWENFSAFQHLTRRNYRFQDLVEKTPPGQPDQDVVEHVLGMGEKYGFTCEPDSVEDAVRSSADMLGVTLDKASIEATARAVLRQQEELEESRQATQDEDLSFGP